jgi:hypothetical protein
MSNYSENNERFHFHNSQFSYQGKAIIKKRPGFPVYKQYKRII